MKPYHLTLIFIVLFCSNSFGQDSTETSIIRRQLDTLLVDKRKITIFPFHYGCSFKCDDCKQGFLTNKDCQLIDDILMYYLGLYNKEQMKYYNKDAESRQLDKPDINQYLIKLKRYYRQYAVAENGQGQKIVLIYFRCDYDDQWQEYIEHVYDGGNCFFQVKINLATGKFYDLRVNGLG